MRCHLATFDSKARLVIERNVGLSATIICCARSVKIGAGTLVGGGAIITDTDFHSRRTDGSWATDPLAVSESVEIGKNCFIGTRAVVLKGVVIGDGAVVGAGAVVANSIPPGSVAVGNPARVIHDEGLSKIIRDKVQM
jgi:acetyltransferase-like isoleucine patch superfamily enzyme